MTRVFDYKTGKWVDFGTTTTQPAKKEPIGGLKIPATGYPTYGLTDTNKKTAVESRSWQDMPGYAGWNPNDAAADFAATGGAGKEGGGDGGSGNNPNDVNDFVSLLSQLTGSPMALPELNVASFEDYEKKALDELRPYYDRILKEEGGDVEKAKIRIEDDYKRGLRINREDYERAKAGYGEGMNPGESVQDYYNRTKALPGTNPQEGVSLLDEVAKRGMLESGFAKIDAANLATAQQRRQEAIKTAKDRYEEDAGITKGRSLEDMATNWARRQWEIGQNQTVDAGNLARQKRSDDISTQEIERSNILRKAINNLYG